MGIRIYRRVSEDTIKYGGDYLVEGLEDPKPGGSGHLVVDDLDDESECKVGLDFEEGEITKEIKNIEKKLIGITLEEFLEHKIL